MSQPDAPKIIAGRISGKIKTNTINPEFLRPSDKSAPKALKNNKPGADMHNIMIMRLPMTGEIKWQQWAKL